MLRYILQVGLLTSNGSRAVNEEVVVPRDSEIGGLRLMCRRWKLRYQSETTTHH